MITVDGGLVTINESLTDKCPVCGKFVSTECNSNGFYDKEDRNNEESECLCFCDEKCANKYHKIKARGERE